MGGFLIFIGLVVFVIAAWGVVRGRVKWARINSRRASAGLLVAAFVVFGIGGALSPQPAVIEAAEASTAAEATAVTTTMAPTTTTAAPTTTTATPVTAKTAAEVCAEKPWPLRAPALTGWGLDQARAGALSCFALAAATAPDGHDVLRDGAGTTAQWRIVSQVPAAGAQVAAGEQVRLTVVSRLSTPVPSPVAAPVVVASPEPAPVIVPAPAYTPAPVAAPEPVQQSAGGGSGSYSGGGYSGSCGDGGYINSEGNCISSPVAADTAPSGASAQCNDGTYSFSQSRRGTCSGHGGVAEWL